MLSVAVHVEWGAALCWLSVSVLLVAGWMGCQHGPFAAFERYRFDVERALPRDCSVELELFAAPVWELFAVPAQEQDERQGQPMPWQFQPQSSPVRVPVMLYRRRMHCDAQRLGQPPFS